MRVRSYDGATSNYSNSNVSRVSNVSHMDHKFKVKDFNGNYAVVTRRKLYEMKYEVVDFLLHESGLTGLKDYFMIETDNITMGKKIVSPIIFGLYTQAGKKFSKSPTAVKTILVWARRRHLRMFPRARYIDGTIIVWRN